MSNEAATATDRFFEVMDTPRAGRPGRAGLPAARGPERRRDPLRGRAFRYPDAPAGTPDLLTGIDLHIRPGETMALVGATGSGKTTLTALIPRLYEATGGRITLDGVDIAQLSRDRLRDAGRDGLRGTDAVLGDRAGERADGRAGSRRGGPAAGAGDRAVRLRARPAAGRRHPGRRAGAEPVRRPAPAAGAGPRGGRAGRASWCSTTRCRRWTCTPRRWSRRRCARCWRDTTALVVAHRPSTVHARRPGGAAVRRPDHRRRHPSRTAGRRRRVPLADVRRRRSRSAVR